MVSGGVDKLITRKKAYLMKEAQTQEVSLKYCMIAETLFHQHITSDF